MKSSPTINIKLIQGLNLLTSKEVRQFLLFSSTKYFSVREYSGILQSLALIHKTGFDHHTNKTLIEHLTGKHSISKRTLLNRMSELYKIFEMFIINKHFNSSLREKNLFLIKYYAGKKSYKMFDYVYNSTVQMQKRQKVSIDTLYYTYNEIEEFALRNFHMGMYDSFMESFSLKSKYTISYFLLLLLTEALEFNQQIIISKKPHNEPNHTILGSLPLDEIISRLKNIDDRYFNMLQILHHLYMASMDYTKISDFREARRLHRKLKSKLTNKENEYIYFKLITYCINQTNFNNSEFNHDLFQIIDEKLKEGYIEELKIDNFPVNNFRDYVIIGVREREYEWVRKFIKDYSHYLPVTHRNDTVANATGLLAITEKRYAEALEILSKVKKNNFMLHVDSSMYSLRAYYELKMFYEAFNELDRIKQYVTNNKKAGEFFKKDTLLLIKDTLMLFRYAEGKASLENFAYHFRDKTKHSNRRWIMNEVSRILDKKQSSSQ